MAALTNFPNGGSSVGRSPNVFVEVSHSFRGRGSVVNQGLQRKLIECCAKGELTKVRNLLNASRVDLSGASGAELLHEAAHNGRRTVVELLLQKGVPPGEADAEGWTALMHASLGGHLSTVRLLLQAGADPLARCQGCLFSTALGAALVHSRTAVLEALLETDAMRGKLGLGIFHDDLHLAFSGPLFLPGQTCPACSQHKAEPVPSDTDQRACIELLYKRGGLKPYWSHPQHGGGLHLAAEYGRKAVLSFLLAAGADANMRVRGDLPLLAAIRGGHPESLLLLLQAGADVTAPLSSSDATVTPLLQCTLSAALAGTRGQDYARCTEIIIQNLVRSHGGVRQFPSEQSSASNGRKSVSIGPDLYTGQVALAALSGLDIKGAATAEGDHSAKAVVGKGLLFPPRVRAEMDLSLVAASRFGLVEVIDALLRYGADPNGGKVGTGVSRGGSEGDSGGSSRRNSGREASTSGESTGLHSVPSSPRRQSGDLSSRRSSGSSDGTHWVPLGRGISRYHSSSQSELSNSFKNLPSDSALGFLNNSMDLSGFRIPGFNSVPSTPVHRNPTRCAGRGGSVGGQQGRVLLPQWEHWWKPLHAAVFGGHVGAAKRLLRAGADVNAEDKNGVRALCHAARRRDTPMLELLLAKRACWCPLGWADQVEGGKEHPSCVLARATTEGQHSRWEATHGLFRSLTLRRPLPLAAAELEKSRLMNVLELVGFDAALVPVEREEGFSEERRTALQQLLLRGEGGAGLINASVSITGHTLLHLLAICGRADQLRAVLAVCPGAEVGVRDHVDGVTPLHCAAAAGSSHCVGLLLSRGADPNRANHKGARPLHLAAMSGSRDCMRMLVEAGGEPNRREETGGWTPLHVLCFYASSCRVWKSIEELIELGADPGVVTEDGRGCLHLLASSARGCANCRAEAISRMLKDHLADAPVSAEWGMSPRVIVERGALGKILTEVIEEGNAREIAVSQARMSMIVEALNGLVEAPPHMPEKDQSECANRQGVGAVEELKEGLVLNWPLRTDGPVAGRLVGGVDTSGAEIKRDITLYKRAGSGVRCANPGCWVEEVPKTEDHPGVQLMRCSLCRSVKYCSKACQVAHWKEHRTFCNARRMALSSPSVA